MLLVIDAAYAEYVSRNDYELGVELVDQAENVVMTRTFSKIYGLGGVRLGWMYGPAGIVDVMSRLRQPFNVNLPAQIAGIAALDDIAHTDASRTNNDIWLPWLSAELAKLGLKPLPSVGNFLTVGFGSKERAAAANDWLMNDGLIPRMIAGYGLPEHLRITIGTEAEVKAVRSVARPLRRRANEQVPQGQPMFDKIALIGIGLIGGSIALGRAARRLRQEDRRRARGGAETAEHRQPAEAGRPLRHRSRRRLRGRRPGDRLHAGRRLRRGRPHHRARAQAGLHRLRRGLGEAGGGRRHAAAHPGRRAFRAGPSGRRHREFRPRGRASPSCSTAAGPS